MYREFLLLIILELLVHRVELDTRQTTAVSVGSQTCQSNQKQLNLFRIQHKRALLLLPS